MTVYEDEIDLRPFILALVRRWWIIALVAFLAAGAGLVFSLLQPRTYQATASILLTRSPARLSLAEQFPTVSEPTDSKSRIDALVSLTQSDAVALSALQAVGDLLPAENHDLVNFKNRVEVSTEGDVILVMATADEPELASDIANAWARGATSAINAAYSGGQPITEIQAQLVSARDGYESAQTSYEGFVESNQIALLETQVAELENLLSSLAGERSWQISFYIQRIQLMDQLIAQAEGLQRQVEGQRESPAAELGDALAVLLARASAFSLNTVPVNLPVSGQTGQKASQDVLPQSNPILTSQAPDINLQLDNLSALISSSADYGNDLDVLVQQATAEREEARDTLERLATEVSQSQGDALMGGAAAQLSQLEEQLERETARERQLLGERDLAWDAYQAILQKETELISASQVNNEVTLAGVAVPPQRPVSRGTVRNSIIGGAAGALLAVMALVIVEWWRASNIMGSATTAPPMMKESSTD